jgi:hypothetical protein
MDWNAELASPFKVETAVRFVCVDIEAYEKNHEIVTEVGLAILDTDDLEGVAPGPRGENWFELIKARHLRVDEYSYMVNQEYIKGCPENFNFGSVYASWVWNATNR